MQGSEAAFSMSTPWWIRAQLSRAGGGAEQICVCMAQETARLALVTICVLASGWGEGLLYPWSNDA